MCEGGQRLHSRVMSSSAVSDLSGFSESLTALIAQAAAGAVALKAAPYRVVSGVVLQNNLIAMADHTLRRDPHVPFKTASGHEGKATVLGRDPSIDVAILEAEASSLPPSLTPADESSLQAGALAAIVGYTFDVGVSASLGILGAVGGPRRTWRGGTLDRFLRLDANLYPSQAGAAVVTHAGSLIGMATAGLLKHSAVAVPVVTLNRVAEELVREGRIRHGYLGVGVQPIAIPDTLRSKLGANQKAGLIVLTAEPDSPAEKAGLQVSDILVALNERDLLSVEDLQDGLRGDAVGRTVPVVVLRGGERIEVEVAIGERTRREK